jgi:hypothetical protein
MKFIKHQISKENLQLGPHRQEIDVKSKGNAPRNLQSVQIMKIEIDDKTMNQIVREVLDD